MAARADAAQPEQIFAAQEVLRCRLPGGVAFAAIGVLAITHYRRLLDELHPDFVHVFVDGMIVRTGGLELADELERGGYARYLAAETNSDFIFP